MFSYCWFFVQWHPSNLLLATFHVPNSELLEFCIRKYLPHLLSLPTREPQSKFKNSDFNPRSILEKGYPTAYTDVDTATILTPINSSNKTVPLQYQKAAQAVGTAALKVMELLTKPADEEDIYEYKIQAALNWGREKLP